MIKGLYIHIPFCDQICLYCDFCKLVAKPSLQADYIEALLHELNHELNHLNALETIYIGGGTPSALATPLMKALLEAIRTNIDLTSIREFTIEANPNDITVEWLDLCKTAGVNRISLGVQTTKDRLTTLLKRTHLLMDTEKAIEQLRSKGFENFNLDFIFGIPGQQVEDLNDDLDFIERIRPPHISYYSLIIEPHTELSYRLEQGTLKPMDEDLEADMNLLVKQRLKALGYHRYEVSNYALANQTSKHNLLYWNLEEYLGIGLGAASQYDQNRYRNEAHISTYIMKIHTDDFSRDKEAFEPAMEYLLLGLRKTDGIDLLAYQSRFHSDVFSRYPRLKKHLDQGLLEITGHTLRFTDKGMDVSNQVYLDILEESS